MVPGLRGVTRDFLNHFFANREGAFFACDADEGRKAFLHRFAVAGAAVRYREVHRDAVEDIIEPYMIQQGFIQRTPRGRVLTANAWKHLGMQPPKDLEAAQFRLTLEDE